MDDRLQIRLLRAAQDVVNEGIEGGAAPGSWIPAEARAAGVLVDKEIFDSLRAVVREISDQAEATIRRTLAWAEERMAAPGPAAKEQP